MKAKESIFKINLQLFAGLFDPNDMPTNENPLLAVDAPVDVPIDTLANQIDTPPNEPNTSQPDFDIKAYLDSFKSDLTNDLTSRLTPQEPVVDEPVGPSEEELASMNEDFLAKFYENPMQSVQELAEKIANEKLAPIMQEREFEKKSNSMNQRVSEFKQNTPDFDDYIQDMIGIIQSKPYLQTSDDALEVAYNMAKGQRVGSNPPQTFESMLEDPATMEKLLGNEDIRNKILQHHMKGLNQNQPPKVIGSGAGQPVITPPNEPKTLKDGTKLLMQSLQQ